MRTADISDQATNRELQENEAFISAIRANAKPVIYTGFCLFCEDELPEPERFCDDFCRNKYELLLKNLV